MNEAVIRCYDCDLKVKRGWESFPPFGSERELAAHIRLAHKPDRPDWSDDARSGNDRG